MPVQLGTKGQPDFTQPVELMMDCHRRIEKFLQILLRVVDETQGHALDRQHREALETALNYFRSASPRHNEDEEDSLFPRMRRSSDPEVRAAMAKLDALEADHRVAERHHARVDELGKRWLAADALDSEATAEMKRLLTELGETYREHIRVEDEEVFPLASRVLSAEELGQVGQEMQKRRRQNPGRPESRCAQRRAAQQE